MLHIRRCTCVWSVFRLWEAQPFVCVSAVSHRGTYHHAMPALPRWEMDMLAVPPRRALQYTISRQILGEYLNADHNHTAGGSANRSGPFCLWRGGANGNRMSPLFVANHSKSHVDSDSGCRGRGTFLDTHTDETDRQTDYLKSAWFEQC